MYTVEKGYEVPGTIKNLLKRQEQKGVAVTSRKNLSYPWHEMEVGDSFFVPAKDYPKSGVFSVRNAAVAAEARLGRIFTTHATSDGVRVWRIE